MPTTCANCKLNIFVRVIAGYMRVRAAVSKSVHLCRVSHPSAHCGMMASYILTPHYTDGTITAGPIAAASRDGTGPICGMKHRSQLHLCVSLIHPSRHPSSPTPSFHSLPPPPHLPRGKFRASLSGPNRGRLIWAVYLFVIPPIISPPPRHFIHSQKKKKKREKSV